MHKHHLSPSILGRSDRLGDVLITGQEQSDVEGMTISETHEVQNDQSIDTLCRISGSKLKVPLGFGQIDATSLQRLLDGEVPVGRALSDPA
jgi:hypothetical protein